MTGRVRHLIFSLRMTSYYSEDAPDADDAKRVVWPEERTRLEEAVTGGADFDL